MERAEPRTVGHLGAALLVSVGALSLVAMFITSVGSPNRSLLYVAALAAAAFGAISVSFSRSAKRLCTAQARDAQRLEDLEALVQAAGILQGETRKERVGDLVARLATGVLHGASATVMLGQSGPDLVPGGSFALEPRDESRHEKDIDMAREALRTRRVVVDADLIAAPLMGATRAVGVFVVRLPADTVATDPFLSHVAQLFGSHAGLALERLEVIHELASLVAHDPLTGVGNRRHAMALLDGLGTQDAVLLVDIDRFKLVNDRYGHAYGDQVLAELGHFLRDHLRGGDSVARYGGEEFLIVLGGVGGGARAAACRLIMAWRAQDPAATISIGYAAHEPGTSPQRTFDLADEALYRAKGAGRDRVSGYESGRSLDAL